MSRRAVPPSFRLITALTHVSDNLFVTATSYMARINVFKLSASAFVSPLKLGSSFSAESPTCSTSPAYNLAGIGQIGSRVASKYEPEAFASF